MKIISTSRQLGTLVKRVRKAAHMTQKDLAAASGTGIRFIQELEKGKGSCELEKALIVTSMLGIRLEVRLPFIADVHAYAQR
ncbi:MAG: helix-turn-helix transcriptional regulator [Gammaproteobacteria bacterium]|jgi:y4mF family transcriptional regulator|nr:helix-turn-helix transcriptional regulator [Gammaproteobacteria bacterium]